MKDAKTKEVTLSANRLFGFIDSNPTEEFDTPQHMASVHVAYAEGRKIQFWDSTDSKWKDIEHPSFNWIATVYRVKPEWYPKVGEIVLAKVSDLDDAWVLAFFEKLVCWTIKPNYFQVHQGRNGVYNYGTIGASEIKMVTNSSEE